MDSANNTIRELEARLRAAEEALVEAAIPLEVLDAEIPYIRHGPLRKKVKALSPEFEAQVHRSLSAVRAVVGGFPVPENTPTETTLPQGHFGENKPA